jgi:hypothetical protein
LNKLLSKSCRYCARGWPISNGTDGIERHGRYHIQECQYLPGHFGGGFVECEAADERTMLATSPETV